MSQAGAGCSVLDSDASFLRLKDHFISVTGMDYYTRRDDELYGRISERMAQLGLSNVAAYYELLLSEERGQAELDRLIELTTVGETHFFRHRELFTALRDIVLPEAIARRSDCRRLRIWSAGCSIGAEPYSVSILLRRELAGLVHGWDVTIVGTDINHDFLEKAAKAEFDEWAMRDIPEDVRRNCFEQHGKQWHLKPEYKRGVSFQRHNLVQDLFSGDAGDFVDFDVILCRNVMIYFSPELNQRIIEQMHGRLADGGWLLLGHADHSNDLLPLFHVVNAEGAVLYKKQRRQTAMMTAVPQARSTIRRVARPRPFVWPSQPAPMKPADAPAPAPTPCCPVPTVLETIGELANAGRLQDAAEACERLLANNDLDSAGHYFYALILGQLDRDVEAIRLLRRAIYLDRNYAAAHHQLGLLLQKQGQHEQSARCFRNAEQLTSTLQPVIAGAAQPATADRSSKAS